MKPKNLLFQITLCILFACSGCSYVSDCEKHPVQVSYTEGIQSRWYCCDSAIQQENGCVKLFREGRHTKTVCGNYQVN
ncbi:MAG: hypothetical protein V4543_00815 [Bacteroidota bacterium]